MDKQKDVEDVLSHILRRNGLSVANLGVYQKTRDFRIQEVFPGDQGSGERFKRKDFKAK